MFQYTDTDVCTHMHEHNSSRAQQHSSLSAFECDEEGLVSSTPPSSQHHALVNIDKQVTSGCVHGVATETASTESVDVECH